MQRGLIWRQTREGGSALPVAEAQVPEPHSPPDIQMFLDADLVLPQPMLGFREFLFLRHTHMFTPVLIWLLRISTSVRAFLSSSRPYGSMW